MSRQSGVYGIRNEVTGEIYVGSSIDLTVRRATHFRTLRQNRHKNKHLQSAYNKYGQSKFSFTVLDFCVPSDCISLEQAYVSRLNPAYLHCPVTDSKLGCKQTKETKQKISAGRERYLATEDGQEFGEYMRQIHLGTKRSDEAKARMSQGQRRYYASEAGKVRKEEISKDLMGNTRRADYLARTKR